MNHVTIRDRTGAAIIQRVDSDLIRIGRAEGNSITLEDTKVSRFHAEIRSDGEMWTLVDLSSRNGTRLNGRPVTRPVRVKPGDEIGVGRMVLTLRRPPPGARANGEAGTTANASSTHVAADDPVLVGISAAQTPTTG